ncbi:MAG: hypothetical protein MH186_01885 [Marinobacter sp.]|nr:hypothetical protein [Marinobacter sp.]
MSDRDSSSDVNNVNNSQAQNPASAQPQSQSQDFEQQFQRWQQDLLATPTPAPGADRGGSRYRSG